ncbi:carbohydrate kinase family protein [Salinispira pacifica]
MAQITVLGGANMDIQGYPSAELLPEDSNPGRVTVTPGGVGRNIAENAARMGARVRFISVFGTDAFAAEMRGSLKPLGVDVEGSLVIADGRSSVYLCILERSGRLHVAVADMEAITRLEPGWIDLKRQLLTSADLCVVDANLQQGTIEHIARTVSGVRLFLDPVSETKAARAREVAGSFFAMKPNRREAEVLSGVSISSDADLARAAEALHRQGTRLVFISLGGRGLFYSGEGVRGFAEAPARPAVNVSGAGDAASAAIAHGICRGLDPAGLARRAVAAAALTVGVDSTVNPEISTDSIDALASDIVTTEA